jgi:hypothetical protein
LCGGLLAGFVNREVLDSHRFASSVNAVRHDDAVATAIGGAIAEAVLKARPDLIAVRPLLAPAAASLVSSSEFDGLFQSTIRQLHANIVHGERGFVVNLTDVGAIATTLIPLVAPSVSDSLPADLNVKLANISAPSFGAKIASFAHWCALLSWLLPLAALLLLGGAIAAAENRLRGGVRVGWAVFGAGGVVTAAVAVATIVAAHGDGESFSGTLRASVWRHVEQDLWTVGLVSTALGGVLLVAAYTALAARGESARFRRLAALVTNPSGEAQQAIWALGVIGIGLFAALAPGVALRSVTVLAGIGLVLLGAGKLVPILSSHWRSRRRSSEQVETGVPGKPGRLRSHPGLIVGLSAVVIGLFVVVALGAEPASNAAVSIGNQACNGSKALCDRRYSDVAFPAAHNAMSAADEPGWFLPEQPTGMVGALNAGVRVLLFDAWYGQTTGRTGLIATAGPSLQEAIALSRTEFGNAVTDSALRLRESILSKPTGSVEPYLCHGLCETGATKFEPRMEQVRDWFVANPREVVTLFIEDYITPADTAKVLKDAGIWPYVHVQQKGQPWPTLGEMIDSGKRVVVLLEKHDAGPDLPQLLNGFDWVQDTSYTTPTVADLSCTLNRGKSQNDLLLLNTWLSSLTSAVTDARKVNAYDVLWPYAERCRQERGQIPNFVAVNYYNQGALLRVVNQLNGLGQ